MFAIPEPRLAGAILCIVLAVCLALLVLGCDKDGNFRAR